MLLKDDKTVWWEGLDGQPPEKGLDWKGNPWTSASGENGAHPNSRFTAPASQCPCISPEWEDPKGVPISAFIFGGRRAKLTPLVYESFNWQHGVFVGATMASETTAAATHAVGVVRRDPMAMLPFCGYNMSDYFSHWLNMGKKIKNPPKIFNVNWFKTDENDKFIWPGFGDNLRVLEWIIERATGDAPSKETPIGYLPTEDALDLKGLDLEKGVMDTLLEVNKEAWLKEYDEISEFFKKFGDELPKEMAEEHQALKDRLNK